MAKFEPIPDDFMNVVLGQVYKKLTNGGDPTMLGPNNFVAWEPVATVIDEEAFDFATKGAVGVPPMVEGMTDEQYQALRAEKKFESYAFAEEFARLADQIPSHVPKLLPDGKSREFTVFSPAEQTVSNVYSDALEFSVVKDSKEDPKVVKRIEQERKKLFKTKKLKNPDFDEESIEHPEDNPKYIHQSFVSPAYAKYLEYEMLYEEAEEMLTDLQMRVDSGDLEAMSEMTMRGRNVKRKRDNALKRWESMGYKGKVEKVMNYLDEVESSNFLTLKKRYESELLAASRTGLGGSNTYHYSSPIPGKILENSSKWTKFEFSKSDYDNESKKTTHKWSTKASYGGIGKINAEGKHEKNTSELNFNDFKMSFKITKCFISRPWHSSSYLKSRYWKYSKHGKDIMNNQMLSDGKGGGLLPAITTEFYLLSELNIGFKKGSSSYKKVKNIVDAGGGVRVGLFKIGASYGYASDKVNSSGEKESQGVTSDGILLVGRKCKILDLAPNPLPSIKDDEWIKVK